MERLKKIYSSLSKTELRYLRNYLGAFHGKGSNKSLELLENLARHPDFDQAEMSEELYGDPRSKAFIMMKGRLTEKMIEILSLSVNFQNNPAYKENPTEFESINIQKQLMYAMILRRRGLEEIARELLLKCAKRAEEYALPEYKVLALVNLRNISASQKEVVWNYKTEIEKGLEQLKTDVLSSGIFDEMRVVMADKISTDAQSLEYFEDQRKWMEQRLEKAYSPRAHYYYLHLSIHLTQEDQRYDEKRELISEMISLLESHKGLGSRNRLGVPYIWLAALELNTGNFTEAYHAADKAMGIFNPKKHNYLGASTCKVYACILTGRLDEGEEIIAEVQRFGSQKRLEEANEIMGYLQACVHFIRGDGRQTLAELHALNALLGDKKGWNVGLRIFEIMILIDLELIDLASARVETLRKHVAKYEVDPRSQIIFRYLYLLERQSFNLSKPNTEMLEIESRLKNELPWKAFGHELIQFECWLEAKQKGKTFADSYYSDFLKTGTQPI